MEARRFKKGQARSGCRRLGGRIHHLRLTARSRVAARAVLMICALLLLADAALGHPAWGIVIDRQGQVYFSDVDHNTVWKVGADGRPVPLLTNKHSHELFIDDAENLYGGHVYYDEANDRWINSLWKATSDGRLTEILAPTTDVPKGLGSLMDWQGNTYAISGVNDGQQAYVLARRRPDGSAETLAGSVSGYADGKGAEAKFAAVQAKVLGPDQAIYLTDAACVRRVSLDGTVTTLGGNPLASVARDEHARLLGLAVDRAGNVYVADYDFHCLRRVAPDGSTTTLLESGSFWSPSGIAVVGDTLYVLEHRPENLTGFLLAFSGPSARIRMIEPDGQVKTIAALGSWAAASVTGGAILAAGIALVLLVKRVRRRKR